MDPIELGVLEACYEVVLRQREMLPLLATALHVPESRVFYTWALRQCSQRGTLPDTDWLYFFHGLECALRNQQDGRCLRIDFGPQGRVGFINDGGVLGLIQTSVAPWREFPDLRAYFAESGPPSFEKIWEVMGRLDARGAFEKADPALIALQAKFSSRGPDGLLHIRFPAEISEETLIDCSVAHRQHLSQLGLQLLKTPAANGVVPSESSARNGKREPNSQGILT